MIHYLLVNKIKQIKFDKLHFLILITFLYVIGPSELFARGISFKPGKSISIIPFKNLNGLIIIVVKIQNQEVNLILDSGVRNIVLFNKAGHYGLKNKSEKHIYFSGIGNEKIVKGELFIEANLEAPNIEGTGLAVVVIPSNHNIKALSADVNGLIGYDLFSKFLVAVDYKQNIIMLLDPSHFYPDHAYQKLEMNIVDTKPYLETSLSFLEFEEKNLNFFIDTGASFNLVISQNPFPEDNKNKNKYLAYGLTGLFKVKSHLIKDIYINKIHYSDFLLWVPLSSVYLTRTLISDRDGTLGGIFLQNFEEVVFDYSNEKIYFKLASNFY
jgi:hypothetical protein